MREVGSRGSGAGGERSDAAIRLDVYMATVRTGQVPDAAEVATLTDQPVDQIEAAFVRLAAQRTLVLEPGSRSRIRMAPPFSAVETPFLVTAGDRSYYANCVWDALGIPAALGSDAKVAASDGHTGEPLALAIAGGAPVHSDRMAHFVAHFAVPAAHWWDDIVHT